MLAGQATVLDRNRGPRDARLRDPHTDARRFDRDDLRDLGRVVPGVEPSPETDLDDRAVQPFTDPARVSAGSACSPSPCPESGEAAVPGRSPSRHAALGAGSARGGRRCRTLRRPSPRSAEMGTRTPTALWLVDAELVTALDAHLGPADRLLRQRLADVAHARRTGWSRARVAPASRRRLPGTRRALALRRVGNGRDARSRRAPTPRRSRSARTCSR